MEKFKAEFKYKGVIKMQFQVKFFDTNKNEFINEGDVDNNVVHTTDPYAAVTILAIDLDDGFVGWAQVKNVDYKLTFKIELMKG